MPSKPEVAVQKLLQIQSSILASNSQSSPLATRFVAEWLRTHPGATSTVRDVGRDPVPHLTGERFQAFLAKPEARTPEQQAVAEFSDTLIDELRQADVIVLGLPMYNFGIPSSLKAYFDHVARAGETFRYTANGSEGLLKGKKAYVFATRGGQYAGTPLDTQTSYVRIFLRFIGIEDVEFVYAEGLALGDAPRNEALVRAKGQIDQLFVAEVDQPLAA